MRGIHLIFNLQIYPFPTLYCCFSPQARKQGISEHGYPDPTQNLFPHIPLHLLPFAHHLPPWARNREPDQNRGRFGDGEPVLRPHAGMDEEAEPRDRRRGGFGIEPAVGEGPEVGAVLLREPVALRGPGPWSLVPGDPGADIRVRGHVGRPASDERVRAAGVLHG